MRESEVINLKFKTSAIIFLFVLLIFSQSAVFAGNQPTGTLESTGSIKTLRQQTQTKNKLQAAQMRYEQDSNSGGAKGGGSKGGGIQGGDSQTRSYFSFFSSIFVLLFGIWALLVLLKNYFSQNRSKKSGQSKKIWELTMKPSFALAAFGFVFVATVIGSQLIVPSPVSAEKHNDNNQNKVTSPASPASKAVFKSAQQIGGDGITQIGSPIFDAAGNRYVYGGFSRTLDIGVETLNASRDFDLFFAKYDAFGTNLWVRQATGAIAAAIPATLANEGATVLTVDGGGNVYLGGSFVKTITLPGGVNPNQTLNDAGGAGINYESFVAKYDANGNLLWAKGGSSNSPQNPNNLETGQNAIDQIVIDSDGNPFVTGFVSGTNHFGSPYINSGQSDILLTKLDPTTGEPVWKQFIGGTDDDNGLDLEIDAANNLYLIGTFASSTITFPDGMTLSNPEQAPEDRSINTFIAKFNAGGENLWVKNLNNAETLGGSQVTVNAAGEIFLTGYFFDVAIFDSIVLTENEGSGEEEESSLGGYIAKMDADGDFIWAKGFGGLGEGITLDASGRVYIIGTFWDKGTFGAGELNQESLASFGGDDLFVARFNTTSGSLDWAKAIAATGVEGQIIPGNPSDLNNKTENSYTPLGISYNPARGSIFISGDFQGALALDCITLTTGGTSSQAYVAELSKDNEATNCRIWNGLDSDDNNFDSPGNWNGGILPSAEDSVYVPYTGNNFDPPTFNPATNIPLSNVTIADDRILTLKKRLTVTENLNLLGGFVDAELFPLFLDEYAGAFSITNGLVLGKVEKLIPPENAGFFTFPVGTADGKGYPQYSPVTISNFSGDGSFSVTAHRGTYPNTATNLPANRANRWWNLENDGLKQVDVTFKYVDGDITQGMENQYRAYRIPTGGGTAELVKSTIDTTAKTVTALNVSQFSDWTLAQPIAPTAAPVSVGGRVTSSRGRGVLWANVSITDSNGQTHTARTNFLGFYRFEAVNVGQTYIFNVRANLEKFESQIVSVHQQIDDLNFSAR